MKSCTRRHPSNINCFLLSIMVGCARLRIDNLVLTLAAVHVEARVEAPCFERWSDKIGPQVHLSQCCRDGGWVVIAGGHCWTQVPADSMRLPQLTRIKRTRTKLTL